MTYNYDFLYAGLIICLVMLVHTLISPKKSKGFVPNFLTAMIITAAAINIIDIVDSSLISNASNHALWALYAADILLYEFQLALPAVLCFFTLYITGNHRRGINVAMTWAYGAPLVATMLMVLSTPWTHLVFAFDPVSHAYSHGPLVWVVYACAILYGLVTLVYLSLHWKYIRRCDAIALCLDVFILFASSVVQSLVPQVCIIGFGISCAILAFYISFTDTVGLVHSTTGSLDLREFRRRIALLTKKGTHFNITFITITNYSFLGNVFGSDTLGDLMQIVGGKMGDIFRTNQVYKFQGARFCVITYCDDELPNMRAEMRSFLNEPYLAKGSPVRMETSVTTLYNVEAVACDVDVELFLDFLMAQKQFAVDQMLDTLELKQEFREFRQAAIELDHALIDDTFELYFHPLYSPSTGKFDSVEVLSRLKDRSGRMVSPALFVSIAESNGTIREVSRLQFVRLCRFMEANKLELLAAGVKDIKFNISPAELSADDQKLHIFQALEERNLDPSLFSFEITESAAYSHSESAKRIMTELKDAGCRVWMDDFGSGFANLNSIFAMPFDGVKIDLSLLRLISTDDNARKFYKGLVEMVHMLDKSVVSEGVETAEEVETLTAWGVDCLQGYYFSKPLPAQEYLAFLAQHAVGE